jgi:4-diphosphocytidyl-2-C-methyl-D-erythritol kinase
MTGYLAPAKVNLRLAVLAREASGYHQIETLFCALDLADELDIERRGRTIELAITADEDLGPARDNLVQRAADAFYRATGEPPGARIALRKRIPAGCGLGGGSSDAAATLRALNHLHGGPLAPAPLLELGAALGSDVPFFLSCAPLALAWGRGQRLLPLPALPPRPVLVLVPDERMRTPDAYRALAERRAAAPIAADVLDPAALRDWSAVATAATNDFEAVLFDRMPALVRMRDSLHAAGARPALLAGSGSALFGVFADDAEAAAARRTIAREHDVRIIETRTASGGSGPSLPERHP